MNAPDRTDRGARDAKGASASAADRQTTAATRRMQLDQVRASVRAQLADIHRRRQELSARRKPAQKAPRPSALPVASGKSPAAGVTEAPMSSTQTSPAGRG